MNDKEVSADGTKIRLHSELYNRTCKTVVASPASWEAFLRSACYNYRLRFDEQLLVFAQRPDATAVLEIERWNGTFGRWVNKGATGIAVFEDVSRKKQRLIHYFDISDTHPSRYSRPVPIWEMKPEYEAEIIETLESTFGELREGKIVEKGTMCKMARGQMARWLAEQRVERPGDLRAFAELGYRFSPGHSDQDHLVFIKGGA